MVSSFSFCSSPSSVSLSLTSPFSSSSWCGDLGIQQPRSPTAHSTPLGPGCHVSVLTASGTFHSTCFWHPSRYAVAYIRNLFFHCLLQLPSSSVSTFGWYRNAKTCSRSWQLCVLAVCRNSSNKMASAPKISDGAPNHWTLFYSHNSSCKWVWEFSFFVGTLLCINCIVTYQSYVDYKGSLWGQIPCRCLYMLAFIPLGISFNTMYTE